jgi:hypothetical protein
LVYSIHDPTELAIKKMIEASQRMLRINNQGGEGLEGGGISPAMNRHLELEIETLQYALRDADKLRQLLKLKARQREEAMHIEDTERLVTEIEMLKVVLYLMMRSKKRRQDA